MEFTESGTFVVHIAVLIAGAVYLVAMLLIPDVVFGAIAWATGAVGDKIAQIGSGYGAIWAEIHTLPKQRGSTVRSRIIGVLHRWWGKVQGAFGGLIGRQPMRIRALIGPAAAGEEE